ncbi:MAG: VWA domain-containing protein [Acidobacteria bacterium]|nr:VWA domain-containing protein [Acidobacteriota bacterium]
MAIGRGHGRLFGVALTLLVITFPPFSTRAPPAQSPAAQAQSTPPTVARETQDDSEVVQQSFTNDLARLEDAVEQVGAPRPPLPNSAPARAAGGGTAVYDALFLTCYKVLAKAPTNTRRAVILLTDGLDNGSRLRAPDAVNAAVYANAVVYGIGVGSSIDEDALSSVSEETAGRAFFPEDEGELRAAFARIEQELRSQYLIAYTPTNRVRDGKRREVRVEIAEPQLVRDKLKLAYRRHYYVRKAGAARREGR